MKAGARPINRTLAIALLIQGALSLALVSVGTMALTSSLVVAAQRKAKPKIPYYRISASRTLHVRLGETLSSESARVGDTFTSTVVDPVHSTNGIELIPAGSTVTGRINAVKRAGKDGKPATIDVSFFRVRLPNGRSSAMNGSLTDLDSGGATSDNEGTATAKKTSHRNVKFIGGGAAGGAVIGAIAGGGKGAAIGAGLGAGAGFLTKKLRKGHEVQVKSGTEFGIILNQSISLPAYRPS